MKKTTKIETAADETAETKKLIRIFDRAGYDTGELAGWSVEELRETARAEGLLREKAAKPESKPVFDFATMTLGAIITALAEGTLSLRKWADVGPILAHERDDTLVAPDVDFAWMARGKLDEGNQITREICAGLKGIRLKGIPKDAKPVDVKTFKVGNGFQPPYFTDGRFVYRNYKGNKSLVVAAPVAVLKKHFKAAL